MMTARPAKQDWDPPHVADILFPTNYINFSVFHGRTGSSESNGSWDLASASYS